MTERPTPAELQPDDRIQFLDFHRPSMLAGDYTVRVTHQVSVDGAAPVPFTPRVRFSVAGERLALTDDLIDGVFPPRGGDGPFSDLLPHVVLRRPTLPWERQATEGGEPWLALVLFEQSEAPTLQTGTLGSMRARLGLTRQESAQHDDDPLAFIELSRADADRLLPTQSELAHLTHVRAVTPAEGGAAVCAEQATVIGARLIDPDKSWVVHLVSVEDRYDAATGRISGTSERVALLTLAHWTFRSSEGGKDLVGLLTHLDVQGGGEGGRAWRATGPDGRPVLHLWEGGSGSAHLHTPPGVPAAAVGFLRDGYTLLPHELRTGDRTVSWYRGPLAPRPAQRATAPIPARSADALLVFDAATGCFDASFAAAWELGRLMALQDARYGVALVHWKQAARQAVHRGDAPPPVPDVVRDWLERLVRLDGVPFDYLVPDERLLPVESIRFFEVDPDWVACLMDGAFSLGRVLRGDQLRDEGVLEGLFPRQAMGGVLLRSEAVAGYPALEVDAYRLAGPLEEDEEEASFLPADQVTRVACVRRDRLGPHVLLCLFDGPIDVLELHLHPQSLHFGFDRDDAGALTKVLRSPATGETWERELSPTFRAGTRVLDVDAVATAARRAYDGQSEDFSDGDLAFQLLQAPPLVRYLRPKPELASIVEGIGPRRAEALRAAGIETLADLRALLHRPVSAWPDVAGCSASQLRRWALHAELLLIPGLDEHQAELMVASGIEGLLALAAADPAAVLRAMGPVQERRRLAPWLPTLTQLAGWVAYAQRLIVDDSEEGA